MYYFKYLAEAVKVRLVQGMFWLNIFVVTMDRVHDFNVFDYFFVCVYVTGTFTSCSSSLNNSNNNNSSN